MIDFILALHYYNVFLVLAVNAVAAIFGLVIYFKNRLQLIKPWRVILIASIVLGLLQGLFGLIMVLSGKKAGGGVGLYYLHYVYGGIVALGIPLTWLSFTTNGKDRRKDILIFSLASLVLVAAAVRAFMTGA